MYTIPPSLVPRHGRPQGSGYFPLSLELQACVTVTAMKGKLEVLQKDYEELGQMILVINEKVMYTDFIPWQQAD